MASTTAVADGHAAHQSLRLGQFGRRQHGGGFCRSGAGRRQQHGALIVPVRIGEVDLQQEAVELGFGQRIGAFLLDRILRREHMEGPRQRPVMSGDRDVPFLHRLQQRGLGARAGAVDLIGHQQLAEDRAGQEAKGAAPTHRPACLRRVIQNLAAEDIGGHQIGRELHAPRIEAERPPERFH